MSNTIITLSDIPTLTELYKKNTFQPAANPKYPPNAKMNDIISLYQGSITELKIDAIVNAANTGLAGGGGIDGAIHKAAGPDLYEECAQIKPCPTGFAKITGAYNLSSRRIIHAVGPVYHEDKAAECKKLLQSCYRISLEMAIDNHCSSIAFPCISAVIFHYPHEDAARAAVEQVRQWLNIHVNHDFKDMKRIIFDVLETAPEMYDVYKAVIPYVSSAASRFRTDRPSEYFPPVVDGS